MVREEIEKEFEAELEKRISNYKTKLSQEEILTLLDIFLDIKKAEKRADFCLNQQFSGGSVVDYTNDFEKANAESVRGWQNFNMTVDNIKTRLNESKHISSTHK